MYIRIKLDIFKVRFIQIHHILIVKVKSSNHRYYLIDINYIVEILTYCYSEKYAHDNISSETMAKWCCGYCDCRYN